VAQSVQSRRRRSLGQRLGLAGAALVVELLLIEAALGLIGLMPPEPRAQAGEHADRERKNFVADPELGWRMRSGANFVWRTEGREFPFRADARGFRIDERPDAPVAPASAPRIALVGDSFTFGTGVTFADTFGAKLAAALGAVAENRAQPGFGVDQMWRTAELEVLPDAPPDLIVVGLILDDFERTRQAYRHAEGFNKPRFRLEDGRLVRSGPADNLSGIGRFLDERSRLFTLGEAVARRLGEQHGIGDWWRLNAACLTALFDAAAAARVPVLVVHIATVAGWRPFPALRALVEEAAPAVALVDLATEWGTPPEGAYYPLDGHLNATGHAVLAALLAEKVRQHFPAWPARPR